jgi:hypothetical protein
MPWLEPFRQAAVGGRATYFLTLALQSANAKRRIPNNLSVDSGR